MLCFVLGFHPSSPSSSSSPPPLPQPPPPPPTTPSSPLHQRVFWHKYLQTEGSTQPGLESRRTLPVVGLQTSPSTTITDHSTHLKLQCPITWLANKLQPV
ncbi:protein HUA2-LIKE 1-like [Sphaeramia orbicularis]|uniref:protein HUA2-LIKE 1-like n=1 Tax=Sphaeramia orbicularis TaxID=375764 RepID=UPI00117C1383|nr:protein HUA2-LIKE 1-like [Sphaeramia orbicularis]